MTVAGGRFRAASVAPFLVIAAGIGFVLYLQAPITAEVFFNGDGGIKFLLARQFASGDLRADLHFPAPEWARSLWTEGLFPFHPPFVYEREDLRYAQYPIYFPLLSAPFYRLVGLRGLYVIPALALFVHWLVFRSLCARLRMGAAAMTVATLTLAFASPLTLYAAMFWEHTLAVTLAFTGLAAVVAPPAGGESRWAPLCAGLLTGLSTWFRPELACFVILLAALSFAPFNRGGRPPWWRGLFAGTMLAATLASLIANWILSGHPMGFYRHIAYAPGQRLALYPESLAALTGNLLYFYPLVLVPAAYLLLTVRDPKRALAWPFGALLAIGILFLPVVPLLLPMGGGRQWGPRYLLILVPLVALLSGLSAQRMSVLLPRLPRYLGFAILAGAAWLGFLRNTVLGGDRVVSDTESRVLPALDYVLKHDSEVVAVSRQWISEDLAAAFDRRRFFLTPTFADLARLAAALGGRGASRFLYLCLPSEPSPPPLVFGSGERRGRAAFARAGDFGQYTIYEARIGTAGGGSGPAPEREQGVLGPQRNPAEPGLDRTQYGQPAREDEQELERHVLEPR